MARVTVEDCVLKVPNRFELVLLAAQRAREITSGAPLTLDRDDDKNPVVALREIADEPEETHELELDPALLGVPERPDALLEGEAPLEAEDIGEEEAGLEEEVLDEELAVDILGAEEEADLADVPARDLPDDFDEDL